MSCDIGRTFSKYNISYIAIILGLVSFLINVSTTIVISSGLNFVEHLHQPALHFAYIRMIGEILGYFSRFLSGILSDLLRNRRTFLLIGYGSSLLTKLCFWVSGTNILISDQGLKMTLFDLGNINDRIFNFFRDSPRDGLITDYSTSQNCKTNIIIRKMCSYIGTMTGAILAIILSKKITFNKLFLIPVVLTTIAVIILFCYAKDIKNTPNHKVLTIKESITDFILSIKTTWNNKDNKHYLLMIGAILLLLTLGKVNETIIWTELKDLHVLPNMGFILFYLFSIIGSFVLSFFRKIHIINFLLLSSSLCLLNNIIMLQAHHLMSVISCICVYGFCYSIMETSIIVLVLQKINRNLSASIISFTNLLIGLGLIIPGLVKAYSVSYKASFIFSIINLFLALSLILMYRKKIISSDNRESNS